MLDIACYGKIIYVTYFAIMVMAHDEHAHGEHEHGYKKHTALWLIITVLIVSISIPVMLILLGLASR